ncbi:hypothetical protein B0H14DRAFT_2594246 [Mycena olivaceomarginata]|nr:hypothetical protein B0H14DRAFT_2594246 [Mycena olivaceomarginata]
MELRAGNFDIAKVEFLQCFRSGRHEVKSFCLERLADMESWHVTTWDWRWPVIYLVDSVNSKQKLALHKALLFLGDLFLVMENEDTATSLFKVALAGFTDMDVHHGRAQSMLRLGNLANRRGHISEAKDFWTAAQPLFQRSLQGDDVAKIDSRIMTSDIECQKALFNVPHFQVPVELS